MNLKKPEEFFNVLVSVKLLKKDGLNKYTLNDISSRYLSRDQNNYYGYFFTHATAPGAPLASNLTQLAASLGLPKLDLWCKYKTVLEVGGNVGHLISSIIK